ncbi:hypothetical protein GCM10025881_00360 [Pseudolysinimonas kribbensis]|uniref:DUF1330 domain-containing protein n=1 Tax=Pseudolysinimonas kribbensis TaxID=433641 RepID=A0ABQ6K2S5_9MICO|nr:hypothetical protein [Pseudolysinimonas kribbensis]GMA93212.1 hypothetical protein GCM10025881_00360 [Pseudolysinimonas kribbensis]
MPFCRWSPSTAARSRAGCSEGADGTPHEVQIIEFADREAMDAFLGDPRRTVLAPERDRVVARTELFPVRLPGADGGAA